MTPTWETLLGREGNWIVVAAFIDFVTVILLFFGSTTKSVYWYFKPHYPWAPGSCLPSFPQVLAGANSSRISARRAISLW